MIVRFDNENDGTGYYNILQLVWLFIVSEVLDYLHIFGGYDPVTQVYNTRRILWVVLLTIGSLSMAALIALASIAYLFNFITGIL